MNLNAWKTLSCHSQTEKMYQNKKSLPCPHILVYILERIRIFKKKKKNHSFIDLGLHFDWCENESYSTFVAKTGFLYTQISI